MARKQTPRRRAKRAKPDCIPPPRAKRAVARSVDLLLQKERLPPSVKKAPVPAKC